RCTEVVKVIEKKDNTVQLGGLNESTPGVLDRVPENRCPGGQKQLGCFPLEGERPDVHALQLPVLYFPPNIGLNRLSSRDAFTEGVQQKLREAPVIAEFFGHRERDWQHVELRLRRDGGAFREQAAFSDSPCAQDSKRGSPAGCGALFQSSAEGLKLRLSSNEFIGFSGEVRLWDHSCRSEWNR